MVGLSYSLSRNDPEGFLEWPDIKFVQETHVPGDNGWRQFMKHFVVRFSELRELELILNKLADEITVWIQQVLRDNNCKEYNGINIVTADIPEELMVGFIIYTFGR